MSATKTARRLALRPLRGFDIASLRTHGVESAAGRPLVEDITQFRGLEVDRQLQTNPRALRKSYLEIFGRYLQDVKKACASQSIDYVQLSTAEPLDAALAAYLTLRQKTRKRPR